MLDFARPSSFHSSDSECLVFSVDDMLSGLWLLFDLAMLSKSCANGLLATLITGLFGAVTLCLMNGSGNCVVSVYVICSADRSDVSIMKLTKLVNCGEPFSSAITFIKSLTLLYFGFLGLGLPSHISLSFFTICVCFLIWKQAGIKLLVLRNEEKSILMAC